MINIFVSNIIFIDDLITNYNYDYIVYYYNYDTDQYYYNY